MLLFSLSVQCWHGSLHLYWTNPNFFTYFFLASCWVLLAQVWKWSNLSQQHPPCRNKVAKRVQHVAPNNVAICCVGMFRSFGWGFTVQLLQPRPHDKNFYKFSTFIKRIKIVKVNNSYPTNYRWNQAAQDKGNRFLVISRSNYFKDFTMPVVKQTAFGRSSHTVTTLTKNLH